MVAVSLKNGRDVGAAYAFLLELRLERGLLDDDEAERELRAWWADRV